MGDLPASSTVPEAGHHQEPASHLKTGLYAAALLLIGLVYRATFIADGYSPTDEGWLQSLAGRVLKGELPYRDFNFTLPPVTLYKEALLIRLFGDAYGILAARFAFALEASLISVLAFLIIRRFASNRLAFFLVAPTIFFSVILYYFPSYGLDGMFFSMLALTFLQRPSPVRTVQGLSAGVAVGLAFLSKPPYLAVLALVALLGILANRRTKQGARLLDLAFDRAWWPCFVGFSITVAAVAAYFAAADGLQQFLYQAFLLKARTHPFGVLYFLWQDLPAFLLKPPHIGGVMAAVLIILLLVGLPGRWKRLELPLVVITLIFTMLGAILRPGTWGWLQLILGSAYGLLLGLNLIALVALLMTRTRPEHPLATRVNRTGIPVELPLIALALEYVAQFGYTGIVYSYEGAFLTVPTALLFLYRLSRLPETSPSPYWPALKLSVASAAPILLGLWLVAGSVLVTRDYVYFDAPRPQLTAAFSVAKLAGVRSTPDAVRRLDQMTALVEQRTRPGDAILVIPDYPSLYFFTGRTNPTRQEWFLTDELIPSISRQSVADLQARPPRLVFLEKYSEYDLSRSTAIDYEKDPKLAPLYDYLKAHYVHATQVGDIDVLVPASP